MINEQQTLRKCRKILQFFQNQEGNPTGNLKSQKPTRTTNKSSKSLLRQPKQIPCFTSTNRYAQSYRKGKLTKCKKHSSRQQSIQSFSSSKNTSKSKLPNPVLHNCSLDNSNNNKNNTLGNQTSNTKRAPVNAVKQNGKQPKKNIYIQIRPEQADSQNKRLSKQNISTPKSVITVQQKNYVALNKRNSVQLSKNKNSNKKESHLSKIMNIPVRKPKIQSYLKTHGFQCQQIEASKYKWQELQLKLIKNQQNSNKRASAKQSLMDTRYFLKYAGKQNKKQNSSFKSTLNNTQQFLKEMTNSLKRQISDKIRNQVNLVNQSEQQSQNAASNRLRLKQFDMIQKMKVCSLNSKGKINGYQETYFPFKICQEQNQQSKQISEKAPYQNKNKVNRSTSILNCIQDIKNQSTLDIIQSQVYSSQLRQKNQEIQSNEVEGADLLTNEGELIESLIKQSMKDSKKYRNLAKQCKTDQLIKWKFMHQRKMSKTPDPQLSYTFNSKDQYPKSDFCKEILKRLSFQSLLDSNGSTNEEHINILTDRNASKLYQKQDQSKIQIVAKQNRSQGIRHKVIQQKDRKIRSSIYDQLTFSQLLNLEIKKLDEQKKRIRANRQIKAMNSRCNILI